MIGFIILIVSNMTNDFLQDSKGNKSSKRLWGSICIVNGILLKNAEWTCGFFGKAIIEIYKNK